MSRKLMLPNRDAIKAPNLSQEDFRQLSLTQCKHSARPIDSTMTIRSEGLFGSRRSGLNRRRRGSWTRIYQNALASSTSCGFTHISTAVHAARGTYGTDGQRRRRRRRARARAGGRGNSRESVDHGGARGEGGKKIRAIYSR